MAFHHGVVSELPAAIAALPMPCCCRLALCLCRVKTAKATCTSHNGMPTLHEYHLSAASTEDIRDSRFMHSSSARDAVVVATKTKLYTIKS